MPSLSGHLLECIATWERQHELDDPDAFELYGKVLASLTDCRESFTPANLAALHTIFSDAKNLRDVLDQNYARKAVVDVPSIVNRLVGLPVVVISVSNMDVSVYLGEATRCYIHGFPQGTIALCRAAIDVALGDVIEARLQERPEASLARKINQAEKGNVITDRVARLARTIKDAGNKVLHEKPNTDEIALAILQDTREVLASLYR